MLFLSCSPYSRLSGLYYYEEKGTYASIGWYLQLKPDSIFVIKKDDLSDGKLDTCYSYYSGKYNILNKKIYVYEDVEVHDVSDMLRAPRFYVFIIQNYKTLVHGEKVFVKIKNTEHGGLYDHLRYLNGNENYKSFRAFVKQLKAMEKSPLNPQEINNAKNEHDEILRNHAKGGKK